MLKITFPYPLSAAYEPARPITILLHRISLKLIVTEVLCVMVTVSADAGLRRASNVPAPAEAAWLVKIRTVSFTIVFMTPSAFRSFNENWRTLPTVSSDVKSVPVPRIVSVVVFALMAPERELAQIESTFQLPDIRDLAWEAESIEADAMKRKIIAVNRNFIRCSFRVLGDVRRVPAEIIQSISRVLNKPELFMVNEYDLALYEILPNSIRS